MATVESDPCKSAKHESAIGNYVSNQPILSLKIYCFICNTENVAYTVYDYLLIQTVIGNML